MWFSVEHNLWMMLAFNVNWGYIGAASSFVVENDVSKPVSVKRVIAVVHDSTSMFF